MQVVGQGYPAYNTAHADFATDANGNAVPAASSTASVTNAAALISGSVYNDMDQSGTLTADDVGLGGVTVQLYTDPMATATRPTASWSRPPRPNPAGITNSSICPPIPT